MSTFSGRSYLGGDDPWGEFIKHQLEQKKMYVTTSNAKVGDPVVLISDFYGRSLSNPVWDRVSAPVVGKISAVDLVDNTIVVAWDNGHLNNYRNNHLEFYVAPVVAPTPSVTITPTAVVSTPATPATFPTVATTPAIPRSSLSDAVANVINREFISKGLSFSGYDVTSALRRDVNETRIIIDGLPYTTINGLTTQKVTHDDIRTIVRDYMNTVSSYDRRFNGDYIVYQTNGTVTVPTASKASAAPSTRQTMTFTPTSASRTVTPHHAFSAALRAYVAKRSNPTLKQIQSRFKMENAPQITIRQIAKVAADEGLKVQVATPYYRSIVRA